MEMPIEMKGVLQPTLYDYMKKAIDVWRTPGILRTPIDQYCIGMMGVLQPPLYDYGTSATDLMPDSSTDRISGNPTVGADAITFLQQ